MRFDIRLVVIVQSICLNRFINLILTRILRRALIIVEVFVKMKCNDNHIILVVLALNNIFIVFF